MVASKTISMSFQCRQRDQPVDPLMRGRHAKPGGALQAVAVRIDAHQRAHLQDIGCAHHLDHQIGADIPDPMMATLSLFAAAPAGIS